MNVYKRHRMIASIVKERGEATIQDLSKELAVSENTIRNDLTAMELAGSLRRVRGGAVPLDDTIPPETSSRRNFSARNQQLREEKRLIGQWAASLVQDGDAIILDSSTTTYQMAAALDGRRNLTVVTNGIETALLLAREASNRVLLASSLLRSDGTATVGDLSPTIRDNFLAPKCFFSCHGITIEQGLTESDVDEALLKRQMLELAQMVIILADHRKFGRTETVRFAPLDAVHLLVTDAGIDGDVLRRLQRETPLRIAIVGNEGAQIFEPLEEAAQRIFRIGFGNLSTRMPFARQVLESVEKAAKHHSRIQLLTLDNEMDRQQTLENADRMVQAEVDLVIEYQLDAEAGNVIMDKFNRAGIPVIAVDIPLPGATFFGADNYRAGFIAGERLGQWIETHWQGSFDYLLAIGTTRVGGLTRARLQGLRNGLESIVGTIGESRVVNVREPVLIEDVEQAVSALLPEYAVGKRFAIIAINDDGAVGALRAFEHLGRLSQVVAVGQNADQTGRDALRRPDFPFIGSTRFAPEEYGERLLRLAFKILNGDPVPPAVYQQHVFLNRDNLDLYYPKGGEG